MSTQKPLKSTGNKHIPFGSGDVISVQHGGTGKSHIPDDHTLIGTGSSLNFIKHNTNSNTAPTSNDDMSHGYRKTSRWIDLINEVACFHPPDRLTRKWPVRPCQNSTETPKRSKKHPKSTPKPSRTPPQKSNQKTFLFCFYAAPGLQMGPPKAP